MTKSRGKSAVAVVLVSLALVIVGLGTGFLNHPASWVRGQFSLILGGFIASDLTLLFALKIDKGKVWFLPYLVNQEVGIASGGIIFIFVILTASILTDYVATNLQALITNYADWVHAFIYVLTVFVILIDYVALVRGSKSNQ